MFLKTVPPAVAIHSEWRSSKSCSLPLFFNDSASDSDLASASGTPIPQKIQMIIESLHSTQSSDMADHAHSSHEAGYKDKARLADTSVKSRRTDTKRQTAGSDTGEDSDSDDSVDRGIEEAIQEYLKEKVDHKRKGDPVTPSPAAKLQRREPSTPDVTKQHIHSSGGKVLTASNHIQRALTGTQPLKKKVKKKSLSKENPFKKADVSKGLPVRSPPLFRSKKGSSSSSEMDRSPSRLVIKEELLDSSSDDGIEEEIQRFQQEKKVKQESEKDTTRSSQRTEDSDSSSDEGIEEAIRRFQAQKHKTNDKKSPLKPAQLVPVQRSKPAVASPECTSAQPLKTLSKKNNKKKLTTKKSDLSAPLTISHFLNKCSSQSSKVKGLAAPPTLPRPTDTQHQIHSSLNVNTAELMCAEAILDISKTVMPEVFESNLSITNRNVLQTSNFPTPALSDDRSNDSSVDSEDGIEQEIRKFLELKAQMNKEPSLCSGDPTAGKEPKKKVKESQPSKTVRLSLSRKRKFKEEQSKSFTDGDATCDIKEEPLGKTSESARSQISSPRVSSPPTVTSYSCSVTPVKNNKPKQNTPARKVSDGTVPKDKGCSMSNPRNALWTERDDSSDKSSSLDSDEDLDAAIKDLLKTKKKVKRKVRDMRARKRPSEAFTLDTLKKPKPTTEQKSIPPAKTVKSSALKFGTLQVQSKSNKSPRSKAVKSRSEAQNSKQTTSLGNGGVLKERDQEGGIPSPIRHADDDDDSSVNSDDSIEQEIRRFLAERAKVATPVLAKIKQEEDAEEYLTVDVKSEQQQIPIEPPASVSGGLQNNETQMGKQSTGAPSLAQRQTDSPADDKGPVLTKGTSCVMGFWKTEHEQLEISTTSNKSSLSGEGTPVGSAVKPSSFTSPSISSETPQSSGHQHQNLFLMNELKERPSRDCQQSRQTPRIHLSEVIRSVCSSPISKTKPLTANPAIATSTPGSRTEEIYLHNHMMDKNRHRSDTRPHLTPVTSHLCQPHLMQRDQTAFSTQTTNRLQVRQTELSESRASLEEKQREGDDRQKEQVKEEKCIDETDKESDEDRKDEKMRAGRQHHPSQCLSTSIDPGILLSPYIALNTEERRLKFKNRRLQVQKLLQCSTTVKRRLQFVVSVPR